MRYFSIVFLSVFMLSFIKPALAIDYLDGGPVSQSVGKTAVRDCRAGGTVKVPLITWGADMVTIHANGNAKKTAANSLFGNAGLDLELFREDDFAKQVEAYLNCDTPYLRATTGMANMMSELTEADPRTRMIAVYQHSWSAGGDALVVKEGIATPANLKGKVIALQKGGPHVDYLMTVLKDAGLKPTDVKLKWTKGLVGFDGSTPAAALLSDAGVDAAMVIIPDALALTSDGNVGTGSENSVKGGHILLSTRSANRVIADLYFVRADYLETNRDDVQRFVHSLVKAEEETRQLMQKSGDAKRAALIKASAQILLDSEMAATDAEAMWADAETAGWQGNVKFFTDANYPRGYHKLNAEAQTGLVDLGQIVSLKKLGDAGWEWSRLKPDGFLAPRAEAPKFNQAAVTQAITKQQAQGTLDNSTLFEFEINFKPNQDQFPAELYKQQFERVVDLAATYSGAVITVEGHSDPLGYLKALKEGKQQIVLNMMVQSARNLSVSRAQSVRDSIISMAGQKQVFLDPSQFVVVGMGFQDPKSGMCGKEPCAPKSENDWLSNMRVVFRIVNVEAEAAAFQPL